MEKKDNNIKRKKKISNKTIIAILIILLICLATFLIRSQFKNLDSSRNMTSKEINDNSYNSSNIMRVDLSDIKTINFDLKTTDVRIQRSNTNPYIEYTKLYKGDENVYDVKVNIDNGNIYISSDIKGQELYMKNKIQVVRIFLPKEGSIDEIKGKLGAGQIKISNLESKNLDISLESGTISIDNSYFNGTIRNDAGNINLVKSEMNNASLITKAGDIVADDIKMTNDISYQTDVGSINIKTQDPIDKFDITARLNIGNFILGNVSYRNIKDGYKTENKAQRKIDLRTKIGDIIFNKGEGAAIEKEEIFSAPEEDQGQDNENPDDIITPVDDSILKQNRDNTKVEGNN
ncbi:MAG: DUF4097 family beta strand repeat-containing protein [Peptoniphilaceae bacterium]|nr:DUF4097 family beta strand repeat-containing protein [Peptoniphilaceae bacterium]MDY6019768.1 DUF4097 family beta strand repeat-containing protein [Anaerococcus sp.]